MHTFLAENELMQEKKQKTAIRRKKSKTSLNSPFFIVQFHKQITMFKQRKVN